MGYFELILGLLFVLAVLDLSVGVSNDAVNFLNSAIGSRVTSRRVILLVAGAGVLAGSLFSSGIMEVARSGMPTSTTVSIVFELLGAACVVAFLVVSGNPDAGSVIDYIRADRALVIISGIGISIVLAFFTGTLVQFLSRALFTFERKNHSPAIRIGWSAIAFTVISYFLIIKGLKGVSFIPSSVLDVVYGVTARRGVPAGPRARRRRCWTSFTPTQRS